MREALAALEELNNATTLRLREALMKIAVHDRELAEAKRQGALEALRDVMELLREYHWRGWRDPELAKDIVDEINEKVAALFAQNGRQN